VAAYHTVAQGEHLASIARKYGFSTYKTIWDHPENAALKQKRQNPSVIAPGDQLFIPDRQEKQEAASTEQKHSFQLQRDKLKLRLVVHDASARPVANARCELRVGNQRVELTTDDQGKLEREIAPTDETAFLTVKDPQAPDSEILIPMMIGHLDPVDEESGQKARLINLGYLSAPVAGESQDDGEMRFLAAIEEFQCENGLTVDGKCGPNTQAKLKQVHGC
jgi:N-acetylmuramoyl-L-alanine amidase